ncbi:MAG: hypothetical protein WBX15_18910 [Thermoanaerobaculia bacterium]
MADPRADVDLIGIDYEAVTLKIDNSSITYDATKANGSAQAGLAVTLSAAKTVALAADGEVVLGKLISVESDNLAVVQVGGFCTLPAGTGASLSLGKKIVGAVLVAAEGYIREVNTATAAELGIAAHAIYDAGTTTAVVVKLD